MPVSNDLSKVIPTLFAQGFQVLRSNTKMPRLVNKSFSADAREKGDTIQIPLASAIATTDVVPGAYANDPGNIAPTTASIVLDQWKEAAFVLNEKEVANAINGIVPLQIKAAAASLANAINADLFSKYKKVYGYVGTAGTTPFASIADAVAARKTLSTQLAPEQDRVVVIDPSAEANALSLSAFNQYLASGDKDVITNGSLGRKLGFDWHMDQVVPTHTSTALSAGAATVNGAHSVGALTVSIAKATNSSPLVAGDIISFAGDAQTYTVVADATLAVGNTNVSILPALKVAKSGGEAMTLRASHVVNLAFHQEAFGFASRTLVDQRVGSGADDSMVLTDDVSGLTMRLTYRQEHHRTRFAFDVLWGAALVRPELACRIAG